MWVPGLRDRPEAVGAALEAIHLALLPVPEAVFAEFNLARNLLWVSLRVRRWITLRSRRPDPGTAARSAPHWGKKVFLTTGWPMPAACPEKFRSGVDIARRRNYTAFTV
jgi:hypothetical protein